MSHNRFFCPNREQEAALLVGKKELRKNAKDGDPHSRKALLALAKDAEARMKLLLSWKVQLDNIDCLGEIQIA